MEHNKEIVIHDSNMKLRTLYRYTIFIALSVIDLFVVLNFILKILVFHITTTFSSIIIYWFFPLFINAFLLLFLMFALKKLNPLYVDIFLNQEFFKVDIQKTLYIKLFWNQVVSIETITVKGFRGIQRNIKFIGKVNKLLRVNLVMFHQKKVSHVIESVKTYCQYLNIDVREKVEKMQFDDEYNKDKNIIEALKKNKVIILDTKL
jgi:hypothetical protein